MTTVTKIKSAVRKRDGYRCTRCGMTGAEHLAAFGRQLEVHRVVPGSVYTVEGCVTICKACHSGEPKRKPGEVDQSQPDAGALIRVPAAHHAALESLAKKNFRPVAWELRIALRYYMRSQGVEPPPDSRIST